MKTTGVSCIPKFELLFFWDTLIIIIIVVIITTYRKGYRKKEQSVLPLVFLKRHTQMRHDFECLEGCSLLTFTIDNQHFVTTLNVLFQSSDLEID